jgi:hypothetical protein
MEMGKLCEKKKMLHKGILCVTSSYSLAFPPI